MKCTRLRSVSTCFALTLGLVGLLACPARAADAAAENPGSDGDGEYQVGPDYKIDPDLTDRGSPKGKSFEFSMPLAESKILRGDDSTLQPDKKPVRKERTIYVYVPAAYKDEMAARRPFLSSMTVQDN